LRWLPVVEHRTEAIDAQMVLKRLRTEAPGGRTRRVAAGLTIGRSPPVRRRRHRHNAHPVSLKGMDPEIDWPYRKILQAYQ
jgi:hypothetical protein